ncbi:MAG: penicillin-binding protein activator LpoB [Myxococcota bacterium]
MSTGLDRKDLERVFMETATDLVRSKFYQGARGGSGQATIAILPMKNDSSEHIEGQLETLLARFEDQLVHDGVFAVVSNERRAEILADLQNQQTDAFDPRFAARWGHQLGAQYVVTGKVQDVAERTSNMRRVQYSLFMQVLEVETGRIAWMRSSDVTKALVAW